ncbi:hypothetical protein HUS70_01860 [Pandoraea nosoerga]|uniref:Uncharacterized protein n=1 Tax=Pandoraea nosoerga TaxID=2508296 RepID=A0A5E4S0T4_9BURK|nr:MULTISPECIES: hypothetical protein [Pandoraea]MBN4667685.1 hypothetical protein [Pandoraea nosoerga]MBN4676637.1 hypothetical protein [Pandoraea nosoerga]MBN4683085.1 hypothetical protein [Pandoraea nosoerga]MBN4743432.1 hypothetical protein [Pandoraea nosoerga]VVD69005.1 hypothetical protein PNO31109_00499 [Pandoraea nosoerga]
MRMLWPKSDEPHVKTKVFAVQANLDETVALIRRFAHDEFARAIGTETPSDQDIRGFILDRLRSMKLDAAEPWTEPTVQRVFGSVYVMPMFAKIEGVRAIEARLVVMPDARYAPRTYIPISN